VQIGRVTEPKILAVVIESVLADVIRAISDCWECFDEPPSKLTGPNTTDAVRKAYILQYAHPSSEVLRGNPSAPPTKREPCDDPKRQFPILRAGRNIQ
jgi:hypothetical protein